MICITILIFIIITYSGLVTMPGCNFRRHRASISDKSSRETSRGVLPQSVQVHQQYEGYFRVYRIGDKLGCHMPHDFRLPDFTSLQKVWTLWLNGNKANTLLVDNNLVLKPIQPFYLFTVKSVPKKIWNTSWHGLLQMMMKAPGLENVPTRVV